LAGIRLGLGSFFTLGKLLALATIPLSLGVFVWQLLPFVYRRYRITSRRIVIDKGLRLAEEVGIGLDEFDDIDIVVLPGQDWLRAAELIFCRDGVEVFRLSGVSQPIALRRVCLKVRSALLGIRQVLEEQQQVGHGE